MSPPMRKKLIDCVRPGDELVKASFFVPARQFKRLDFPTLLRPRKANSGVLPFGYCSGMVVLSINSAVGLVGGTTVLGRERVGRRGGLAAREAAPTRLMSNVVRAHRGFGLAG